MSLANLSLRSEGPGPVELSLGGHGTLEAGTERCGWRVQERMWEEGEHEHWEECEHGAE